MRTRYVAIWLTILIAPPVLTAQGVIAPRCDSIQARFVAESAPSSARRLPSPADGQSYALRDSTVVDGHDIDVIQVSPHRVGVDTIWDVTARLTPSGTSAVAAATASHIGQMLAVTLGDTIVAAGIIESQLGSRIPLRLGLTRAVADSLATRARRLTGTSCRVP